MPLAVGRGSVTIVWHKTVDEPSIWSLTEQLAFMNSRGNYGEAEEVSSRRSTRRLARLQKVGSELTCAFVSGR